MEKAYVLWRAFQDQILGRAGAILLLGCTLLALLEIFRRYALGLSFEWQGDAVTFFILSAVFLYFGIAQRRGEHLSVTVVTELLDSLGPRARRVAGIMRLTALLISCAFLMGVVWWGIPEIREAVHNETRTESLGFPMWPFLLTLLLGFAFMAITLFFQIYREAQKLRGVTVLVEPPEEDAPAH